MSFDEAPQIPRSSGYSLTGQLTTLWAVSFTVLGLCNGSAGHFLIGTVYNWSHLKDTLGYISPFRHFCKSSTLAFAVVETLCLDLIALSNITA